ncbi:dicarboxylate/amino acid:cation symporter [Caminicella sporogenes]|uniref:dicarboxylate/amino acid:cation symporter n=1 Tax=Caminicella sporogenes TaxID=166485 RepID=UPI0025408F93|nr:dicarboxylate/amino acid:cation symporter [Caminicella sporogenes]WIF94138.1 dicarboxylate/amino acid:cation symporter [Caminicella sporogenes]
MKKKMGLTSKIFIGLVTGIILGLVLHPIKENTFISNYIVGFLFHLVGKVFINSIKMMVVPLVFVSITVGAASVGDIKKLGRIGSKTLGFYLVTTAVAITIAITLATVVKPGVGFDLPNDAQFTAKEAPKLVDVLIDMVPKNPISALANGKMLQIIVFSVLLGTSMTALGDKATKVREGFEAFNEVILKLVMMIMKLAPYGVFALVAKTFTELGYGAMKPLAAYMLCVLGALLIHALVTYQGLLVAFTKLNPIKFFKNFSPAMMVAFSTASSSSTLPVTLETAEERLGVPKSIASFTLPLGATINMDGTAIMQGVATVFLAQAYGIDLTLQNFLTVILTATLASIGTAGVPGVGLIMLSMVLTQVGIPVEGIAIIMGIDRILDMCRTAINITGDAACTVIIAKQEGELNEDIYNAENVDKSIV